MKNFTLIIVLLLTNFWFQKEIPNDLKIYGLKGNVKSIHSISYGSKKINGKYEIDKENPLSKSTSYFNKSGNIYKNIDSIYEDGKIEIRTTQFDFFGDDNKKSYRIFNDKEQIEKGIYNWISKTKYEIEAIDKDSLKMKSTFSLSEKGRDKSGKTDYYFDGEYLLTYTYTNELDSEEKFISSKFTYEPDGEIWTTLYQRKLADKNGNATKFILIDKENDSIIETTIRKLKYY